MNEGSTPCLVLAGGLGTRLRSVLADKPKCLAPVGSRSFLDIQLSALAAQGFDQVILSLGFGADQVLQAIAHVAGSSTIKTLIESRPLGTGGAILYAMDAFGLDEVLTVNGDTYLDGPLAAMHTSLQVAEGEQIRVATVTVPDRARFGGIEVDVDRKIIGFLEKGHTGPGRINAGLYRIHRAAFGDKVPGQPFSFETDILPAMVTARHVSAQAIDGAFIDIGVPEDYARFCADHA